MGKRINSAAAAKLLQSCPTLCNPIDSSPPGSPIPGILQARINSNMEHLSKSFFHCYITLNYYFGVKSLVAQPIYLLQLVLHTCRFYNQGFNQLQIENIQRKKKFQKVPKARLEFAGFQQLFT